MKERGKQEGKRKEKRKRVSAKDRKMKFDVYQDLNLLLIIKTEVIGIIAEKEYI